MDGIVVEKAIIIIFSLKANHIYKIENIVITISNGILLYLDDMLEINTNNVIVFDAKITMKKCHQLGQKKFLEEI